MNWLDLFCCLCTMTLLLTRSSAAERYIHDPFLLWLARRGVRNSKAQFLYDGLRCPMCVGFWIGLPIPATSIAAHASAYLLTVAAIAIYDLCQSAADRLTAP